MIADFDLEDGILSCPACRGQELTLLGTLGGATWCRCRACGFDVRGPEDPAPTLEGTPLCGACLGSLGGASGLPDFPFRPAGEGEACGAADCGAF